MHTPEDREERSSRTWTETYYEECCFERWGGPATQLDGVEFFRCRFEGCRLTTSAFRRCRFEQCVFEKCDLSLLDVLDSTWIDPRFSASKMLGIDWTRAAGPSGIGFRGCILNHASFAGMALPRLEMIECTAQEVDFSRANLTRGVFTQTNFSGSRFVQTNLSYADFSGARNYAIDPTANRLKATIFSLPEAVALLSPFDIILR